MNDDARVAEIIGRNVRQLRSGEWQQDMIGAHARLLFALNILEEADERS